VENGGALVMTYFGGVVDEFDLAYLGETPHGLTDVLGVKTLELDALYPGQSNALVTKSGRYEIGELCELIEPQGASVLGTYESDFYAGDAAFTHHAFGKGQSWYIAAKLSLDGLRAIYGDVAKQLRLATALQTALPAGVVATRRGESVFVQNYTDQAQEVALDGAFKNLLNDEVLQGTCTIAPFGVWVLAKQ